MSTKTTLKPGMKIRFTMDHLGTMTDPNNHWFEKPKVGRGDEGTYHGPHPTIEGWELITVEVDGETLFVPVHDVHFEIA